MDGQGGSVAGSGLATALLVGTCVVAIVVACRVCCTPGPAPPGRSAWYDTPMPSSSTSLSSEWRRSPSPPIIAPHPSPEPMPWPPPMVCQHPAEGDLCLAVTRDPGPPRPIAA